MIRLFKITFIFAGLFLANALSAQVTLNDLMDSQNATNENRANKKWINDFELASSTDVAREVISTELIKMTKSKHWIDLSSNGEVTNEISFQTSKKMFVDRVIDNLKEAGFVLTATKNTGDSKIFTYTRNNVSVEVLALATESTAQTVYLVTLL